MIYLSASNNNCAFLFLIYLLQFIKPVSKVKKIPKLFYQLALECIKLCCCVEQRGEKRPRNDKRNRSTSFSCGM